MSRGASIFFVVLSAATLTLATGCTFVSSTASESSAPAATTSASPVSPSPAATPTASPTASIAPTPDITNSVQPAPTAAGPAAVTIVNWGADAQDVYASGVVTGASGGSGTCTLTATSSDGRRLTGTRPAEVTPSAVDCGVIRIAAPAGQWSLVLAYASSDAQAVSAPAQATRT